MSLSFAFNKRLCAFFTSLPNMQDSSSWKALLFSATLDDALLNQIQFAGSPAQFFPELIDTLIRYGTLNDGRDALEAVLTEANETGGLEIQAEGTKLIREWQMLRLQTPKSKSSTKLGFLGNVPAPSGNYLKRKENLKQIKNVTFKTNDGIEPAQQTVILQGMGGIGKTELAAAFARKEETRQFFEDGVFWL